MQLVTSCRVVGVGRHGLGGLKCADLKMFRKYETVPNIWQEDGEVVLSPEEDATGLQLKG